jgi:hypothetical protein
MRAFGFRALRALAAAGLIVPVVPIAISTTALAASCVQVGGGSPVASAVVSNINCGTDATTLGAVNNASAYGSEAAATGSHTTAIGAQSDATALDATAVGYFAQATAQGATAVGGGGGAAAPNAAGEFAIAIGGGDSDGASANFDNTIAMGQASSADSADSIAIGHNAVAGSVDAVGTAVGSGAMATGSSSAAYGQGAVASAGNTTAVGVNSTAAFYNSAAFGNGATATRADQQIFGTTSNTYTMAGLTSAASTAAQTSGPLALVTTDQAGNMAADTSLYDQIGENREGVATAMALSNFWVPYGKSFAAGVNVGTWDGTWAIGANVGGQVSDGAHITGGIAVSESGKMGGRVGGVLSW